MRPDQVPQELWDLIISKTVERPARDTELLLSLNGVCRAFRIAIRPHLFRYINLPFGGADVEERRQRLTREVIEAAQAQTLVKILFVSVKVYGNNGVQSPLPPPNATRDLQWILQHTSQLRSLRFDFASLSSSNLAVIGAWERASRHSVSNVSYLSISSKSYCTSENTEVVEQLVPLLSRHPLVTLRIIFPITDPLVSIDAKPIAQLSRLAQLQLFGVTLRGDVRALRPMSLTHLELPEPANAFTTSYQTAVLSRKTLVHLDVGVGMQAPIVTSSPARFDRLWHVHVRFNEPLAAIPAVDGDPLGIYFRHAVEALDASAVRILALSMIRPRASAISQLLADHLRDPKRLAHLRAVQCRLVASLADFAPQRSTALGQAIQWSSLSEVCKERGIEVSWE